VVHDDDLSIELLNLARRITLGVTSDHTTLDILDGEGLDVETNVVTGNCLLELLVVHFDGLNFRGDTSGSEDNSHTRLELTSLDTTDRDRTDTTDLVHILEGKAERKLAGTLRRSDAIELADEGVAVVPGKVVDTLIVLTGDDVITVETGDGDEGDQPLIRGTLETGDDGVAESISLGGVVDGLASIRSELSIEEDVGDLITNLLEALLVEVDSIHLVDRNDDLLDTEGVSKKSVLTGGTIIRDTSLVVGSINNEDSNIGLRGTSNHVLDEVLVAGSINDGEVELLGLELPEGDIDGDTTLTLSLELVENPSVLEGTLTDLSRLLLELLDLALGNTTTLVNHVAGSGGLTRVDVTNDDEVAVDLLLAGHV